MAAAPGDAAVGGSRVRYEYLKFGDHCTFQDKTDHNVGFLSAPITSSLNSKVVVKQTEKRNDWSVDFQACVFQIVAEEKYSSYKVFRKAVKSNQRARGDRAAAERAAELTEVQRKAGAIGRRQSVVDAQAAAALRNALIVHPEEDIAESISEVASENPHLSTLARSEARDNALEQKRWHGSNIKYGDIVQLWHPYSRRFVQVSKSDNAVIEQSSMRVEMKAALAHGCHFRIMPRFKVRSVGDLVNSADEVLLECVMSPGQYLHTSSRVLSYPEQYALPNFLEVSMSVTKGSFVAAVYSRREYEPRLYGTPLDLWLSPQGEVQNVGREADDGSHHIVGGMILQLHHKDSDSYLCAEGASHYADPYEGGVRTCATVDAHLRVRKPDASKPNRRFPPTSAVTWFEFEKVEHTRGGALAWEEEVRLKHVPTQMYLTYVEATLVGDRGAPTSSYDVVLTPERDDPGTVFEIQPEIQNEAYVPSNAYTRIKHKMTKFYLHATTDAMQRPIPSTQEKISSFELKMSKLKWDGADLRKVVLLNDKLFDDAFSLSRVSDELGFYARYIGGYTPVLRAYIRQRRMGELSVGAALKVARELNELSAFMFSHKIAQKHRQKMLRSLQIIDILISMLRVPFADGTKNRVERYNDIAQHRSTYMVMDSVFRLLNIFLMGDSRKNELFMGKHVPFLWDLYGTEMKVEPMFNELLRDNIEMCSAVGDEEIAKAVELLRQDKNKDYLEFLSVLCVIDGQPYRRHQDTVGQSLLQCPSPPLMYTDLVNDDVVVSWMSSKANEHGVYKRKQLLTDFAFSALDEKNDTSTDDYLFLQRQLQLFGDLCQGRHENNIRTITGQIEGCTALLTWKECFAVVSEASATSDADIKAAEKVREDSKKGIRTSRRLLPRSLRSVYVDLIVNLFVDTAARQNDQSTQVDNRDVLSDIELCYHWNELDATFYDVAADNQTRALSGATFKHFKEVKTWILKELRGTERMVHEDPFQGKPQNVFLAAVLRLLHKLIVFGYYADGSDITVVMKPLQFIISGLNDVHNLSMIEKEKSRLALAGAHALAGLVTGAITKIQAIVPGGKEDDDEDGPNENDGDYAALWRKDTRYGAIMDENTRCVIAAKLEALKCVDAFLNFVSTYRLRMLLTDFKVSYFGTVNAAEQKRSQFLDPTHEGNAAGYRESKKVRADILSRYQATLQALMQSKDDTTIATTTVREYLRSLASGSRSQKGNWVHSDWSVYDGHRSSNSEEPDPDDAKLPEVLLDTAKYHDYDLMTLAMRCVYRIYSSEASLFSNAVQAQILVTKPSCRLARELDRDIPWMERESKGILASHAMVKRFSSHLLYYASQCYLNSAWSDRSGDKGISLRCPFGPGTPDLRWGGLEHPNGESWLQNPGGDHQINQNIIFNAGMLPIVLDVLGSKGQPALVLTSCFVFLKAICRNFHKVQVVLMEGLNTILSTEGVVTIDSKVKYESDQSVSKGTMKSAWVEYLRDNPEHEQDIEWQHFMGQAVQEIFNGCRETCLRVSADQVSRLLELLVGYNEYAPSFLDALEAVAKVEEWNLPLKRNQELIIKEIMKNKAQVIDLAYIDSDSDPKTNEKRMQLLMDRSASQNKLKDYHKSLVNLLAATCEGKNEQIEATCRSIFTFKELAQTIVESRISVLDKSCYVRFMLWVYLCADNTTDSGTDILTEQNGPKGKAELLYAMADLGASVAEFYGPKHRHPLLQESIFAFDVYIPVIEQLLSERFFPASSGTYGIAAQKALGIICHCVIQFLENVERQDTSEFDKFRRSAAIKTLSALERCVTSKRVQVDVESPAALYGVPNDEEPTYSWDGNENDIAKRFRNMQLVLVQEAGIRMDDDDDIENALELDMEMDSAQSAYRHDYEVELRINSEFNAFARKLQLAYEGKNTVAAQLNSSERRRLNKHILNRQYCGSKGEDSALPLGPEFQFFVDLFREHPKSRSDGMNFSTTAISVAVRLWEGAEDYQSTARAVDRKHSENIVSHTLRAIRAVFHNEELYDSTQVHLQEEMCKAKGILPLSALLSSDHASIRREALAVMKWVLVDGMTDAQKAFANHFLGSRDEKFFMDSSSIIQKASDAIVELRNLQGEKVEADERAKRDAQTIQNTLRGSLTIKAASAARAQIQRASQRERLNTAWQPVFDRPFEDSFSDHSTAESTDDLAQVEQGNLRLIFSVLQSLCEGHNTLLQDYLRVQPDNLTSHNLVDQVTRCLSIAAASYRSVGELDLLIQTVATLTEFAQGNAENRKVIFDLRATDPINSIFRDGLAQSKFTEDEIPAHFKRDVRARAYLDGKTVTAQLYHDEYYGRIARLDYECVELLLSQIAVTDSTAAYIATEFDKVLDTDAILGKLRWYSIVKDIKHSSGDTEFYWSYGDATNSGLTPDDVSFAYYSLLARLTDMLSLQGIEKHYHREPTLLKRDRLNRAQMKSFVYGTNENRLLGNTETVMAKSLHRIPIEKKEYSLAQVYENQLGVSMSVELDWLDELHRVHFHVPHEWRDQLTEDLKEDLKWSVNRDSVADTQRDFTSRCKNLIADMKHRRRLMNFSVWIKRLMLHKHEIARLSMAITFAINFIILISWRAPTGDYVDVEPDYEFGWYQPAFEVLAIAHMVVAFLLVASYFLSYPPSFEALHEQILGILGLTSDDGVDGTSQSTVGIDEAVLSMEVDEGKAVPDLATYEKVFHTQDVVTQLHLQAQQGGVIPRRQYRTKTSLLSPLSFYHLLYMVMSILGFLYYGYAFSFHLLHVIVGNQTLTRTIQAVTKNGDTLLQVFGLMIIFIYIYALVAFALLRRDMDPADGLYCNTLVECLTTSIRFGLLSGGGLGEAIPSENYGYAVPAVKGMLFDLSFFILITTIGLNVVFGIIVDTFSELRDEKYQTSEHMASVCLVCGERAYEFDSKGSGWRTHKKDEHNMWAYLFFFKYLDEKDLNRYTALEQYVAQQLFEGNNEFYPTNNAICLKNIIENNTLDSRVDGLANDLRKFISQYEEDRNKSLKEKAKEEAVESEMAAPHRQSTTSNRPSGTGRGLGSTTFPAQVFSGAAQQPKRASIRRESTNYLTISTGAGGQRDRTRHSDASEQEVFGFDAPAAAPAPRFKDY